MIIRVHPIVPMLMVSDGAVLDNELGKALGATFALGRPDDLMKLRIAQRKIN